jgi:hypothetical protein
VDEMLMKPGKYEVTPESTFDVEVHLGMSNGRWVIYDSQTEGADTHKLVFRIWTYDEMVELKKKATAYDPHKRIHMLDHDALNRMKVQKLLVSWTFDRENPRLKVLHVNGILTDESWNMFAKLQPNIISYVMERMNDVLEFNG